MIFMRQTPKLESLNTTQFKTTPNNVIPLFGNKHEDKPNRLKITYDIIMLGLLMVDLMLIFTDGILMSTLSEYIARWLNVGGVLMIYKTQYHEIITAIGGIFTAFWVAELALRWVFAIANHHYHRWFFFPFVHWYEALACFPALRALRLLRAGIIIRRLHKVGINIVPNRWIDSGKFYYNMLIEGLSDRVILTAINNFHEQIKRLKMHDALIENAINNNRDAIERAILELLRNELSPKLQVAFNDEINKQLPDDIGLAVERALIDTPELHKYLKLIPVAGSLIENQITNIGKSIGKNVTTSVGTHLFDEQTIDALMVQIAHGIANIDINQPILKDLVTQVLEDALFSFEQQIKIEQHKHNEQLKMAISEH